jgi:hypothetical protein
MILKLKGVWYEIEDFYYDTELACTGTGRNAHLMRVFVGLCFLQGIANVVFLVMLLT